MEFLIKTKSIGGLTEEQFFHFCQENDSLKLEKTQNGEIVIMAPTGTSTGVFNSAINAKLYLWAERSRLGKCFDSSTGFTLPNGAVRSPDASFINEEEWSKVTKSDRKGFAHVCPDFVIELLSSADDENALKEKMNEWMENGCHLAWMINPSKKEVAIYRKNQKPQIVNFGTPLSGEQALPGFSLDLQEVFIDD